MVSTLFGQAPVSYSATGPAPRISASASQNNPATAGYFSLSWEDSADSTPARASDPKIEYIMEESRTDGFVGAVEIYRGRDQATTRSGLADGIYHYRVRRADSDLWSPPVSVRVAHHPLERALLFLSLGFVVFLGSGLLILGGMRAERRADGEARS